jgi:hypothetical protein
MVEQLEQPIRQDLLRSYQMESIWHVNVHELYEERYCVQYQTDCSDRIAGPVSATLPDNDKDVCIPAYTRGA